MTKLVEVNPIKQAENTALKSLSSEATELARYKEEAESLIIDGVDDKKGYKAVDEARKKVKKVRTSIESERKDLVKEANSYLSNVNGHAKTLKESVLEIENSLIEKLKDLSLIHI